MLLGIVPSSTLGPKSWQVALANGSVETIEAHEAHIDGGVLILKNGRGELVVAFGPGAWLEVGPK